MTDPFLVISVVLGVTMAVIGVMMVHHGDGAPSRKRKHDESIKSMTLAHVPAVAPSIDRAEMKRRLLLLSPGQNFQLVRNGRIAVVGRCNQGRGDRWRIQVQGGSSMEEWTSDAIVQQLDQLGFFSDLKDGPQFTCADVKATQNYLT